MKASRFRSHSHPKASRAFTLIELLVVVALLVVVLSLAFPAFQNFSNRSNMMSCVSNLRQMGSAMGAYAADNRGEWCFPDDERVNVTPLGTWISRPLKDGSYGKWIGSGKLFPYINDKRVWVCRSNDGGVQALKGVADFTSVLPPYPTSYVTRGFNQSYYPSVPQMRRLANMERRAIISCTFAYAASNPAAYPLSWHKGTYPVLFSDGSVQTIQFPAGAVRTAVPPDINNNTGMQMRIWDYFDGKTKVLSL